MNETFNRPNDPANAGNAREDAALGRLLDEIPGAPARAAARERFMAAASAELERLPAIGTRQRPRWLRLLPIEIGIAAAACLVVAVMLHDPTGDSPQSPDATVLLEDEIKPTVTIESDQGGPDADEIEKQLGENREWVFKLLDTAKDFGAQQFPWKDAALAGAVGEEKDWDEIVKGLEY